MKAPIVPQKKEDNEGQKNLMKLHTIFQSNDSIKGFDMKEMSGFNMTRIDLLHQLNEETYKTLT